VQIVRFVDSFLNFFTEAVGATVIFVARSTSLSSPTAGQRATVPSAVKDAARRQGGGPEGPSLTAPSTVACGVAGRDGGMAAVQSNQGMPVWFRRLWGSSPRRRERSH
jgi:hypothetical protein